MHIARRDFLAVATIGLGAIPASAVAAHSARSHSHRSRHLAPARQGKKVAPHHSAPHVKRGRPLIMLDPGHGGKDPGCIGVRGTREKDVILAIALSMRQHLLATGRYAVAMTRSEDVFIPLSTRVVLARQHNASLFASLHANASANRQACGASVYTFAYHASDVHSAATAQRENSADPTGNDSMHGLSPQLRLILNSMIRRETRGHSIELQNAVVRSLRAIPLLNPAAHHARFAVLRAPDIASVLTEVGFLTNRHDETRLRQANYRATLALAMAHAVDNYFTALRSHAAL